MARIIKDRMIELRQHRGLDRKRLAKSARISLKQINRIEMEADCERRQFTVERLSQALGVEPGVLTGELPMPVGEQASSIPFVEARDGGESESISVRVLPEEKVAYELVKHTYGIYQSDLVRMAPLLLVLVAENSFAWRRKKVEECIELAEKNARRGRRGVRKGKAAGFSVSCTASSEPWGRLKASRSRSRNGTCWGTRWTRKERVPLTSDTTRTKAIPLSTTCVFWPQKLAARLRGSRRYHRRRRSRPTGLRSAPGKA